MRIYILFLAVFLAFTPACKTRKKATEKPINTEQNQETPKTIGKVSHEYSANGCPVVILVKLQDSKDILTLIPMTPLGKEFDADGNEISFDYRLLKMPNPQGCNTGIPAEIKNITKIKGKH